jgi:hypothetical protein
MVMVVVVFLTALLTYFQSFFWYRHILRDLLIIGAIDAFVVSLLVTPLVIKLILIEQKRVRDRLRTLALTDDLTNLNNRRGFYLLAGHLLKIASRTKSGMY